MRPYYEAEGITIYHGDCREVMPQLGSVDYVIADPPYGMKKAEWDMAIVPIDSWLGIARQLAPVLVFCGVKGVFDYPRPDWILAWMRPASSQRNGALRGFNNWEPILAYGLKSLSNDLLIEPNNDGSDGHPTQKPLPLMKKLICRISMEGSILDPFMGSGTTLRAAKDLERSAIGIEIEEHYCELAARRMSQMAFKFR